MRFVNLCVIISFLLLTSCDPGEPTPVFCQINPQEFTAYCINTKDGDEEEVPLFNLRGYVAVSPDDFGELKKYYKKIKAELKQCQGD